MAPLSVPPRSVLAPGQSRDGSQKRAQGERRASDRSDPFGGQYTSDPFAPKNSRGKLPKIDPLMPTRQADELKKKWAEQRAIEEAQRRAYEHKRQRAQEEAQRQAELRARQRSEQLARQKAAEDFERWSASQRRAREEEAREEEARQREADQKWEYERRTREAQREAQRVAERLAQQARESRGDERYGSGPARTPGALIPPPDAWRSSPPSMPPYGVNPSSAAPSKAGSLSASAYPNERVQSPAAPPQSAEESPREELSQREAELVRLVKLQVEAIQQMKSALGELSRRQKSLELRQAQVSAQAQRESERGGAPAHRAAGSAVSPPPAQAVRADATVQGHDEGGAPEATAAQQSSSTSSLEGPSYAEIVEMQAEVSRLSSPQDGLLTRLSGGLKRLIGRLDPDPLEQVSQGYQAKQGPIVELVAEGSPAEPEAQRAHGDVTDRQEPVETAGASRADEAPGGDSAERDSQERARSASQEQIIQFSQGAFEENIGGLTMSRSPQISHDGPIYPILLQQAQLIKQHSVKLQTHAQRLSQLEGVIQAQASELRSELKKITKRVERAELKADGAQRQRARVKAHQRKISQLEVIVEGLEGKLALFEDRLNSGGEGPATDFRVSAEPGVADYSSIQAAIDAAPVGAYIGVMPGLYTEPIEITKPIKLIGLGKPNEVLIQVAVESAITVNRMGGHYEEAISHDQELEARRRLQQHSTQVSEPSRASGILKWFKQRLWNEPEVDDRGLFEVETGSDEVSIVGISINSVTQEVGGTPSDQPTILIRSGHLRLEKCELRAENGVGVVVEGEDAQVTLRACRVINTRGSALRLRTRATATLSGTRIMKSKENGIDAQGFTSVRLMDCEISNNQRIGVHVGFKSQLIAYQCVISGNSFEGVWMNNQSSGSIRSCDLRGNARGPYDISPDCQVELGGNKP